MSVCLTWVLLSSTVMVSVIKGSQQEWTEHTPRVIKIDDTDWQLRLLINPDDSAIRMEMVNHPKSQIAVHEFNRNQLADIGIGSNVPMSQVPECLSEMHRKWPISIQTDNQRHSLDLVFSTKNHRLSFPINVKHLHHGQIAHLEKVETDNRILLQQLSVEQEKNVHLQKQLDEQGAQMQRSDQRLTDRMSKLAKLTSEIHLNEHRTFDVAKMDLSRFHLDESTQTLTKLHTGNSWWNAVITDPIEKGNHSIYFKLVKSKMNVLFGIIPLSEFRTERYIGNPHFPGLSYSSHRGKLYHLSNIDDGFGPKPKEGDIIGMEVDMNDEDTSLSTISFSLNGINIGTLVISEYFSWDGPLIFTLSMDYREGDTVQILNKDQLIQSLIPLTLTNDEEELRQPRTFDEKSMTDDMMMSVIKSTNLLKIDSGDAWRCVGITQPIYSGIHRIYFKLVSSENGMIGFGLVPTDGYHGYYALTWGKSVMYHCNDGQITYPKGVARTLPVKDYGAIGMEVRIDDTDRSQSTLTYSWDGLDIWQEKLIDLFAWDGAPLMFTVSILNEGDQVQIVESF